jgi:hypothetical protein
MSGSIFPKHFLIFKFRPSNHSEDYTIIATYKDAKTAKKVHSRLRRLLKDMAKHEVDYETDWGPEEANCWVRDEKVGFTVYTAGYLDDVESIMNMAAKPTEYNVYRDYQVLEIRVKVPKGLGIETAMLILDFEEAEALRRLKQLSSKMEIQEAEDGSRYFVFEYEGDGIYDDGILYLQGFAFSLDDRENWEVKPLTA